MKNRIKHYVLDFLFNGFIGLAIFFVLKFTFFYFSPTDWYFTYSSVEPVAVPVDITQDYILMESTLQNFREGDMMWNDVLRCKGANGRFNYVGEDNTSAATIVVSDGEVTSQWEYNGAMPREASLCRLESTITRHLQFGIEKQQFIQSSLFNIE